MAQGFALFAGVSPAIVTAAVKEAEALGYTSFWVNHPGATDGLVRQGAAAAKPRAPTPFAYARLAAGAAGGARVRKEADRSAAIPAYAANFRRMGVDPATTAIAVSRADMIPAALAPWRGVVDEVVLRAIPGEDTVEETLTLVRAAAPP